MNWVLILVIIVLAGYTLAGYAKGFLKILYSLISWLVILIFVVCATPYIEDYIKAQTDIYEKIVIYCEENLREQARQGLEESGADVGAAVSENEIFQMVSGKLPEGVLEDLIAKTSSITQPSSVVDEFIENYGIYDKTAVAIANLLIQGIATLAAMLMGAVVSGLLSTVLRFIAKLPVLGFANRILGLAAGAANGLLVVWIVFYLVAAMCATKWGSSIISQIYTNEFLTYLYENNLMLSILT